MHAGDSNYIPCVSCMPHTSEMPCGEKRGREEWRTKGREGTEDRGRGSEGENELEIEAL